MDKKIRDSTAFISKTYIQTYRERDVRQLVNIGDLAAFQSFMKVCAGLCGQQLNMGTVETELSVSVPTVKRWLSVLETSFAVFFQNFAESLPACPSRI